MKMFRVVWLVLLMVVMVVAQTPKSKTLKTTTTAHSVTLNWIASVTPGVTGYNIYRGTSQGGENFATPLNAAPVTGLTYTDSGLTALTTYWYTVKSFCGTCSPSLSNPEAPDVSATTPADPQPLPPTGLTVGTVAKNDVPIQWQAPMVQSGYQVVSYYVMRGKSATSLSKIAIVPGYQQNYVDRKCHGTCYYDVEAYDILNSISFVLSGPSNVVSAVD